jgi:hypothetical protein
MAVVPAGLYDYDEWVCGFAVRCSLNVL